MKNKKNIIIGIFSIIVMYFILFLVIKYTSFVTFSYDLVLISTIAIIFVSLHIFVNINKLYNFIYKYRYFIGGLLLVFITVMAYNGSSIAFWNRIVQPNTDNYNTVVGIARGIRSDEWMVSTPSILSQMHNDFSSTNSILMGVNSNVTLYPSLPIFDISIVCNIFNLPYFVLPYENAYALIWYGKLFVMFFAWFELFMIITKKKKLYSLLGTMLITFSAVNMWWSTISILIFGPLAILIIYKFVNSTNWIKKFSLSILLAIIGLNYIFGLYPAWQVPFGYVFMCFIIWILLENKNKLKVKDLLYLLLIFIVIIPITIYVLNNSTEIFNTISNTVYPGKRSSVGGYGYNLLFNYFAGIFFPAISYANPSEASNFLSFYPIPILMSIYYIFKYKKKDIYLIVFSICAIFLSIWNYIKLPSIITKITLLSFSIPERTNIVVGFLCILLLIRLISLHSKNEKLNIRNLVIPFIISIVTITLTIFLAFQVLNNYLNLLMIIILLVIFIPLMIILILNNNKLNKYFAVILIILSLYIGGTVNPINKGLKVLTEKPFAKEVQKIVKENSFKKWITVNCSFAISNYLVANGASTINSVNFYPNFELWQKLDFNKEYEDIYNRYAHITLTLKNDDTASFELVENDKFNINLNISDIILLGANYIVSQEDISSYQTTLVKLQLLYVEDGIYIYEIKR